MAAKKPAELKGIKGKLDSETFKRSVEEILVSPVSKILEILGGEDSEKDDMLIDMALARCAYSAYFDADLKKLEWLLDRIGINKVVVSEETSIDLSQLTNEAIVTALRGK